MSDVISLDQARTAREPHRTGRCKCLNPECGHEWQAVIPDTMQTPFECPKCHLMRGVWNCIFDAGSGQQRYTCNWCNSEHFTVRRTDVICVGCGIPTSFETLASLP